MNTEITTIDTNNFNAMAKVMGIASEGVQKKKASTLARLRINHAPILGADKILVKAGTYKLELPEGSELGFGTFFGDKVEIKAQAYGNDFSIDNTSSLSFFGGYRVLAVA